MHDKESYVKITDLRKHYFDIRGVCGRHGCTRASGCNNGKRPMGGIWAWLHYGNLPEVDTKELHVAYWPDYDERVSARAEFENLPDIDVWLDAEDGGRGLGEPLVYKRR